MEKGVLFGMGEDYEAPPRGFLTPIPVGERENIRRMSADPNQQCSAGGVIIAGVHVSGTRPLSSFL